MTTIKNCEFSREEKICNISLDFYENSYVLLTTEGDKSTEIRYFSDELSANKVFNAIKNKKHIDGWQELK